MKHVVLSFIASCTFLVGCGADPGNTTASDVPTSASAYSTDVATDVLDPERAAQDTAGDGAPTRVPCVSTFGNGLSGSFGRLDGYVVAVVPPGGGHACNADKSHVHLQVRSGSQTYDIAVNIDGGFIAEKDAPLPGAAWSEGWHKGGSLDYARDLGLRSSSFTSASRSQVAQTLESALASANHVSVYATTYNHGGAHLVHRSNSGTTDGAVVIAPLASAAHVYAFRFSSQSF